MRAKATITGLAAALLLLGGSFSVTAAANCMGENPANDQTGRVEMDGVSKIEMAVDSVNMRAILCAEHDDLVVEYGRAAHSVRIKRDGERVRIELARAGERAGTRASVADMIVLHLPDRGYEQVTVQGKQAGVSLPGLHTQLDVRSVQGAVSLSVPRGFKRDIRLECRQGAGSVHFEEGAADYTLQIQASGSAVAVPEGFPAFVYGGQYRHVSGSGEAPVHLVAEGSALALTADRVTAGDGQPKLRRATGTGESTGAGADAKALNILQKTGNWGYVEAYLPQMTRAGIDTVVACYNSKHLHPQEHRQAADYYR